MRIAQFGSMFAALLAANVAIAQTLPFEGTWARHPSLCRQGTGTAQTYVTITARRLESAVMTCEFISVLPGGVSFRVQAVCDAPGQKGEEFFTFAVLNGKLHWNRGKKPEPSNDALWNEGTGPH